MKRRNIVAASAAAVAVFAGLVIGYRMIGSPGDQRGISADLRRVQDLRNLSNRLHRNDGGAVPADLSNVERGARDPLTQAPYEYIPGLGTNYQLCATFAFASSYEDKMASSMWMHPNGHYCFHLDASQWAN